MDVLKAWLHRYGRRPDARTWSGPSPAGGDATAALRVAAKVGYQLGPDPVLPKDLVEVDRRKAAELLAYFALSSLVHGPHRAREGVRQGALEALRGLKENARFFTNGNWLTEPHTAGWLPLSTATFDGGVIGLDDENAFLFWVEEED